MLPEGTYQDAFIQAARLMEDTLEAARAEFPGKPKRADSLFVFDDLHCAESYWRTHDKSYLYEVEVDIGAVEHRGDMHLTDAIGAIFRSVDPPDLSRATQLAQRYWQGSQSPTPCQEYLVRSAKAVEKIRGQSDMRAWVRSQVSGISSEAGQSIEDLLSSGKLGER